MAGLRRADHRHGGTPVRPPIDGLDRLGPSDGVHLLHSMGDTFELMRTLEQPHIRSAVIFGAGYVGLEMARAHPGTRSKPERRPG
jgi:pyruvate/2-oxoglutarate dehydrogenase complex dihydrolipoamide dehydrogenase (E3) component